MMYFDSWQAFWAMGKYGAYVWSSFGVFGLVMLGLALHIFWQRKRLIANIRAEQASSSSTPRSAASHSEWSL